MTSLSKQHPPRLHRSFQDISDDVSSDIEQLSMLSQMGWYGSFGWDELLKSNRILIISESGTGKTFECHTEKSRLWELGEPAFYFELAELAHNSIYELLFHNEEERFKAWLASQSDVATVFLDSIDELKLTLGSFESALKKLNKAIAGQLTRIRIIITTRPTPIDISLIKEHLPFPNTNEMIVANGGSFADIAMNTHSDNKKEEQDKGFRTVTLMPLSDIQIQQMAEINGIEDADALLKDIHRRNAADFARRPQDLIELCIDWRDHNRIRTHRDQLAYNIKVKLKPRTDRKEKVQLSETKALEGASRLALAALLVRKLTFRHSAEADINGESGTALDPSTILSDWSADERSTLLERALFGFASYGRVRFHHRSVIEFLAAHQLNSMIKSSMSLKAAKRLLFAETLQETKIIRPSMREVAAWLALSSTSIYSEIRDREPNVLLDYGDPESLTTPQRIDVIQAYVKRFRHGKWRGLHAPGIQVHRFASIEISEPIVELWNSNIENIEVRTLLLEIMASAAMPDAANLAYAVVVAKNTDSEERFNALEVLIKLNDPRLDKITKSMRRKSNIWKNRLLRSSLLLLFPTNIPAKRLCMLLSRITESRKSISGLGHYWSSSIAKASLSTEYLGTMRSELTRFVVTGIKLDSDIWPHIQTSKKNLITILASVCLRLLKEIGFTDEIIRSCIIALRLSSREYGDDKPITELRQVLAEMSASNRERIFWLEDRFILDHQAHKNSWSRFYEISNYGSVTLNAPQDRDWLQLNLSSIARPIGERAVALEALRSIWVNHDRLNEYLLTLKKFVLDSDLLLSQIDDLLKPAPGNHQFTRLEKKNKKRQAQMKLRNAEDRASWVLFWREVERSPKTAFSDGQRNNTAWNLWKVMNNSGLGSREEGWNRRFIELQFNKKVADQLRLTMMEIWRSDKPTLRSERPDNEKGTYLVAWQLGLAAITAESEDPIWATKLSTVEAKLATRYAPLMLNGFPTWLDKLIEAHESAVESVLGQELSEELDEFTTREYHSQLLRDISHATPAVANIFISRLWSWLEENTQRLRDGEDPDRVTDRLRRVVSIILTYGNKNHAKQLRLMAEKQLTKSTDPNFIRLWLPILMRVDPFKATRHFELIMNAIDPASSGPAVDWIGLLFDDREHRDISIRIRRPEFTPDMLLRLLRLAYQHVRPLEDLTHEEVTRPDSRYYAERGRSSLFNALLDTKGVDGRVAIMEMSNDPLFENFKDRALFLAQEKEAEEVDGLARSESEVQSFFQNNETAPTTREEMFSLLMDRIDDIEDLLLRDDSPRAVWAGITEEKIMRREISRELRYSSNHAYVVDQESVTADEKETDIRLRNTSADLEAVIELKLGDNRTGRDLRDTLSKQLVEKYMASDACRSGCLLITISKTRRWRHPETQKYLDIVELQAFLQQEASKIVADKGSTLRISARILDLRPRLPTEIIATAH